MHLVRTRMYNVYTLHDTVHVVYIHVCTLHILDLTSCPNRISWNTQRCSTEWYSSVLLCKGGSRFWQSLSRWWLFFLCKARRCWNRGGHQQVYEWLGEPGAIWFWQTADFTQEASCPICNKRQQNVACCSIGRRVSSQNGRGAAEEVHAFRAVIVQARCGIQVNTMYIHVCTMFVAWMYYAHTMFVVCTYYVHTNTKYMLMVYTCYVHCQCMYKRTWMSYRYYYLRGRPWKKEF